MVGLVEVTQIALNKANLKNLSTLQAGSSSSSDGSENSKDTAINEHPATPKWITPMLLFIDLYEKVRRTNENNISYLLNNL